MHDQTLIICWFMCLMFYLLLILEVFNWLISDCYQGRFYIIIQQDRFILNHLKYIILL